MKHTLLVLYTLTSSALAYESLQGPTELLYWDKARAYPGYTWFGARGTTYLLDLEGHVVHTWPIGTNPHLLTNGNVLDTSKDDPSGFSGFTEVDWSGNIVWQYTETRTNYAPHHDFVRIFNPKLNAFTTLYIANKTVTHDQAIAAGCDPANGSYTGAQMDAVVEVDLAGNIIWEWNFFDHVVQDIDPTKANYVNSISNAPGRLNLNLPGRPVRRDWLHCNSIDFNQTLDQIVINSVQGEFYVIDHGNTFVAGNPTNSIALAASAAGDFLYRFGDPARYEQGDPPSVLEDWTSSTTGHKQIGGSHHVSWIPAGLPGAGQFLAFNNGQYLFERTPQSYIFQINGYLNASTNDTGSYVNPPTAGYNSWASPNKDTHKQTKNLSRQVTWMYYSKANQGCFSHIGSSAQRLPNGNTLICADTEGHIFEVTAAGEVVWEYVSPATSAGILKYKRDNWPMYNSVFRAFRIATNDPALTDRTLIPQDTITGRTPSYVSAPTVSGTIHLPTTPTATNVVWITSTVTNSRTVALVMLTYVAAGATNTITLADDGAHQDGAAGDGRYGGAIPAFAPDTTVAYYVTAQDEFGNTANDPSAAPATKYSYTVSVTNSVPGFTPQFAQIPAGSYLMGDHFGFVDPLHPSDEVPVHNIYVDSFYMETTLLTCLEYVQFLNSGLAQGLIEVRSNYVYGVGGTNNYCDTYGADTNSRVQWSGGTFSVRDGRELHPITGVRWIGAIAYCNWASARDGLASCYNLATGDCALTNNGYRLPTEAEWEYAARGGLYNPYGIFPWGSDTNADGTLANWPGSGDPFETGPYPWTTPVGFYNGSLQYKTNYNWPGAAASYQTRDNANGFGLYDMSGNVWQWVNDWYAKDYYTNCVLNNIVTNPPGPATGDPMPDGKPYRGIRGGNWFNGQEYYGHARVANRNPSYYRGPGDPNGPWFHIGFRVMRRGYASVIAAGATLTNLASGLHFTEGPAADASGNVFFSDIPADTIYKWSVSNQLSVFRTNSGGANGLFFDASGNLLACEGDNGRITSITPQGNVTVVASNYAGLRFNEPNDLWIDPAGGVYFTDPTYFGHAVVQSGEYVYYLKPDRSAVLRVVSDTVRPNGLVGTPNGGTLYLADWGATNVFRYSINADGTLTNKTSFARVKCDGMTLDAEGNLYFCENAVLVYDSAGNQLEQIAVPERPTNVEFGGSDRRTLFITTEAGSLYSLRMRFGGVTNSVVSTNQAPVIANVSISPAIPTTNDTVWITARVTDDVSVANVTLTYGVGSGSGSTLTNSVFLETMASVSSKPWTGGNCNNAWTVTGSAVEQRGGANYGAGNTNGMEFKGGTTNLTDNMIVTASAFNAQGSSGFVEFWTQTLTLSNQYNNAGWTFQLDSGSGYVTRLSELTSTNHAWQQYHYDLPVDELISSLRMRFQFRGGSTESRIDLDQISVKVVTAGGSTSTNVAMLDDGNHQDGTAGDHIYGASIPALPLGATVNYYLTATDGSGRATTYPSNAPNSTLAYIVQGGTPNTNVVQTIGLFTNNSRAFEGYTLVAPKHYTNTYLINNAGQIVNRWTSRYEPGQSAYLLTNGNLLRCAFVKSGALTGGGEGGRLEEYDWDGNLVWEFDYATAAYMSHHDITPLPNGKVLLLVVEKKSYAEVLAAGFNPSLLHPDVAGNGYMLPDSVIEVQPTRPSGGNIVWAWHVWDHLIQNYDATKNNYGAVADHPELINVNGWVEAGAAIMPFWNHMNSIAYNPELDQIVLSVRGSSELWVIDHGTATAQAATHTGGRRGKGGDLLYRWGNPVNYGRGTAANQMLFDQHDAQWIDPDSPGAGNFLIFNNGLGRNYSTVDEIIPPLLTNGLYSIVSGAAYGPTALTWTYAATPPSSMYSEAISGAQRLPNGNTLMCDGVHGILSEVTSAAEIVWRYVCPVVQTGPLLQGQTPGLDDRGHQYNAVFKVRRYAKSHPGLLGRDLTPQGNIELPVDQTLRIATMSATPSERALAWTSLPNRSYIVQYTPSLNALLWANIATNRSIGTMTTFIDTNAARRAEPQGFYRVYSMP